MSFVLKPVQLPKKINRCPIREAVIELRFDSPFPLDAIFGIFYKEFQKDFPNPPEELPILQLPEMVRRSDPNLKYQPYYKLTQNDTFLCQVGGRVFSIISMEPYVGWSGFFEKTKDMLRRIQSIAILDKYTRLGIRYINTFDNLNIFEKVNIATLMNGTSFTELANEINLLVPMGDFTSKLHIANSARITKKINQKDIFSEGSVIDIDTYIQNPTKDILELIEAGHNEEKKLFFGLLREEFIKTELNPEY